MAALPLTALATALLAATLTGLPALTLAGLALFPSAYLAATPLAALLLTTLAIMVILIAHRNAPRGFIAQQQTCHAGNRSRPPSPWFSKTEGVVSRLTREAVTATVQNPIRGRPTANPRSPGLTWTLVAADPEAPRITF